MKKTSLKLLKVISEFFVHFIRRILFFVTEFVIFVIVGTIWGLTFEFGKDGKMTERKIRRIRFMSKLKLYLYKYFGWYFDFIHDYYFKRFYEKNKWMLEKE